MIRGYLIQLDEVGKSYTRQVKKATDVLIELGGIGESVGVAFLVLSFLLGRPFRDLNLALNFRKM